MELGIIIPSFKTAPDILRRSLDSIFKQKNADHNLDIIVVDSSPTEVANNIRNQLADYHDKVRFFFSPKRMLAGEARNFGASQTSMQNLVFLDSDCVWNSNWMDTANQLIKKYPDWIAFNGRVHFEDPKFSWAFALHLMEFHEFLGSKNQSLRFLHSGNLLIRRSFFEQVGGFQPEWLACEDIGFLKTIKNLPSIRREIRYVPELSITHTAHLVEKENILEKAKFMGYWRGFYDSDLPREFKITPRKRFKFFGPFLGIAFFSIILSRSIKLRSFYLKEIAVSFVKIFQLNLIWAKGFRNGFKDSKTKIKSSAPNHPDIS